MNSAMQGLAELAAKASNDDDQWGKSNNSSNNSDEEQCRYKTVTMVSVA